MNIRCPYCSNSFNLGRSEMEVIVAGAGKKTHESVPCPKCRKMIKVPISNMRRYMPKQTSGDSGEQKGSG